MVKTVLITGAAGMVGSHLVDLLLSKDNYKLILFMRWQENMQNLEHLFNQDCFTDGTIKIEYGDLRDRASISQCFRKRRIDHLYHLGAQSYPKTSFENPYETYTSNVLGTENLLSCVHEYSPDTRVINCSSSEVFGRVSREQLPISEDCSFHPASPYAISKVGTDLIGRFYGEAYNLPIFTTRMFTHTGPRRGDVFAESTFAKQIALAEAGLKDPIINTGNLDSLRTWADVRDAVRAYHMILEGNFASNGDVYNIGGTHVCTIHDMLQHLISISNISSSLSIRADSNRLRPIDADLQVPDTTKFKKLSGWTPQYSFEQTMLDLLNYWRFEVTKRNYTDR